jgi:hypothetical protein
MVRMDRIRGQRLKEELGARSLSDGSSTRAAG